MSVFVPDFLPGSWLDMANLKKGSFCIFMLRSQFRIILIIMKQQEAFGFTMVSQSNKPHQPSSVTNFTFYFLK